MENVTNTILEEKRESCIGSGFRGQGSVVKPINMIQSYKDLEVWKKSVSLTLEIYKLTLKFPKEELYGLTLQIRRAMVSIPSNIAEGRSRGHRNEFIQFLKIAYGSGAELETQLIIAKEIGYITERDYLSITEKLSEVMRMLNGLISKLKPNT